jgi:tight adherence protein B
MLVIIIFLFALCVGIAMYVLLPLLRFRADRFLEQAIKQAEANLDALYMEVQARQVLYLTLLSSFLGLLLGLALTDGSKIAGLIFGAAGYFLPKLYFKIQIKRRRDRLNGQLVSAIELVSNALKAGTNFTQALAMIPKEMPAPIAQEFDLVLREMELGVTLDEALNNLVKRVQSNEFELVVTATNIAKESGGNLAEVFDRIAKTIRERNSMLGKIEAMTSEGKMQGIFVGLLPLGLGGALALIDPETVRPLFTTPQGYIIIGAVIVMELMGAFFIKKIITIDV